MKRVLSHLAEGSFFSFSAYLRNTPSTKIDKDSCF